jgi:imidazolonepropionase
MNPLAAFEVARAGTVATLLPGPALLMQHGVPPVAALRKAGVTIGLGTDANAGTFGNPSMSLALGLATAIGLSIGEAMKAATVGSAMSLDLDTNVGRLRPGFRADIVAWDADHEGAFAHRLGDVRPTYRVYEGEET